ncbi:MAG: prepilin peptidase [Xanthobacteraceae bacterium]|nr:prepilin peptidase [Xanthobacteraceae bacterium]MBV9238366.1 prepilin peptidase [Xanthobacteraceae bacterium]MBV9629756.1 prepilin peptidase [Xanthobacteraceae bacterium]
MLVETARLFLFPSLMAFAASSDLLTMTISNRISLALALGFLILATACGFTPQAVLWHMLAGLGVLAAGLALFARRLIGGGDAKLAAVAALWLGLDRLADFALLSSLLGGAVTLAILAFRRMPLPTWLADQVQALTLHQPDGGVPYGIALAAAALVIYPSTSWMAF